MLSLFALASSVSAATNAFTNPVTNITIDTGSNLNITWSNASGSSVGISLLSGEVNAMKSVATVGNNIPNQGEYVWSLPSDIKSGQYALEITSEDGSENFSSIFTIINPDSGASTNSTNSTTSASTSSATAIAANGTSTTSSLPRTTSYDNSTVVATHGPKYNGTSRTDGYNNATGNSTRTTSGEGIVGPAATADGTSTDISGATSTGGRNASGTASATKLANKANVVSGSTYVACAAIAGAAMLMI